MNTIFRCTILLLTTFWLAGCGLKGPLYMPSDAPPAKSESPLKAAQPQPAEHTENSAQADDATSAE
ncbi:MAG: lipoprotein [Enterobacteriaceae bacterium]|nr:lipoprotein [Enterobacteriaceae bacterium]